MTGSPAESAAAGLSNARIYHLGALGQPGHWEVRGDGSGPTIVGGDVYVPGAPGQRGSWFSGQSSGGPAPGPAGDGLPGPSVIPSSAQILAGVEKRRRQRQPQPAATPPPARQLVDMSAAPLERLFECADSGDLFLRASALASLPWAVRAGNGRSDAVQRLLQALDDREPQIVAIAARSLGQLRVTAAEDKLLELLNLEDPLVLRAAATALGQIGTLKGLPALDQLAGLEGPASEAARRAAEGIRAVISAATSVQTTGTGVAPSGATTSVVSSSATTASTSPAAAVTGAAGTGGP